MRRVDQFLDTTLDLVSEARTFVSRAREVLGVEGEANVAPQPSATVGEQALTVLNGMWGDRLDRRGNPLAVDMSLRQDGEAPRARKSRRGPAGADPSRGRVRPRLELHRSGLGAPGGPR